MSDIEAERFARAYFAEESTHQGVNVPWRSIPSHERAWRVNAMRRVLDSLGAVTEQRLSIHGEHRTLRPHEVG